MTHIGYLEATMACFDAQLLACLKPWQPQLNLLQTLPGAYLMGTAMLLVEIGTDMRNFKSTERPASG